MSFKPNDAWTRTVALHGSRRSKEEQTRTARRCVAAQRGAAVRFLRSAIDEARRTMND